MKKVSQYSSEGFYSETTPQSDIFMYNVIYISLPASIQILNSVMNKHRKTAPSSKKVFFKIQVITQAGSVVLQKDDWACHWQIRGQGEVMKVRVFYAGGMRIIVCM